MTIRRRSAFLLAGRLGIVLLGSWTIWQYQTRGALTADVIKERAAHAELKAQLSRIQDKLRTPPPKTDLQVVGSAGMNLGDAAKTRRREELRQALTELMANESAPKSPPRPPAPSGRQGVIFSELMAEPEYARGVTALTGWQMEKRYAPLFATLQLDEERLQKLKLLLLDEMLLGWDLEAIVAKHGLNIREKQELRNRLQMEIGRALQNEAQAVLGEAGLQQLNQFKASAGARELADAFAVRLSYSTEPLQREQFGQLIDVFQGLRGWQPGRRSSGITPISEAQMAQAGQILSRGQFEQLKLFQAEHASSVIPARRRTIR